MSKALMVIGTGVVGLGLVLMLRKAPAPAITIKITAITPSKPLGPGGMWEYTVGEPITVDVDWETSYTGAHTIGYVLQDLLKVATPLSLFVTENIAAPGQYRTTLSGTIPVIPQGEYLNYGYAASLAKFADAYGIFHTWVWA